MKNVPDLLQQTDVINTDLYLSADASKINEDDDNINISMGKYHETVEYQETLKVDVKSIAK